VVCVKLMTKIVKKVGRPSKIDEGVVNKLENAFSVGASDSEACSFAGISRQAYYTYLKKNPEFLDRVKQLKSKLPLKAKTELARMIQSGDTKAIFYYLDKFEKRDKLEEEQEENKLILETLVEDELSRLCKIRKFEEDELDRLNEYALCVSQVKIMRARLAQQGEVLYSDKTGGSYSNPLMNQLQSVQNRMDKLRDNLFPVNKEPAMKVVRDIRDEFI